MAEPLPPPASNDDASPLSGPVATAAKGLFSLAVIVGFSVWIWRTATPSEWHSLEVGIAMTFALAFLGAGYRLWRYGRA